MESDGTKCSGEQRLRGKVAIITGGARGIGATTAKLFALNGAYVVVADVLDELGINLAQSIGGRYIHCDVSKEADLEAAVNLALAWKGHLDIIFNNAGTSGADGSITNVNMEEVKNIVAVNLYGVVHGIKHAARAMIKGKIGGSIICTSSSAAIMGGLASHAYTMSKGAIQSLIKSAACELGVHGIRVNCISPHGVPTDMLISGYRRFLGDIDAEEVSKISSKSCSLLTGRGGKTQDVAAAALFLATDEAGFITGHNLVIDGGYTEASTNMIHMYQDPKLVK
ncbi:hypothetical protein SOVF_034380 [Spinacia oleracea]|uniref:Short-chain dehydrogenase reductase ATA1 isoform X1 n=1 Tax=Spinacia oleracea TaxID=3562 RepID=A0A9R0K7S4_SPIOL|nr:short-chain dehydrogenase reductase ATA1 isoform X1 [Spinacia oleracea]KNA22389.1 hypothetical protein SOVF_034380 [Spinacia oleracea]